MKQKDLKIIACLRSNARMSLTKMSKDIRIPVSTIFDRLRENEHKLIKKHTTLIDFSKLGYNIRANIAIKVDNDEKEPVSEYLVKHEKVNSAYKINNGFNFMIEGVFRHINEMEEFIDEMESKFKIKDKNSFFIIEDLKREAFMADYHLI